MDEVAEWLEDSGIPQDVRYSRVSLCLKFACLNFFVDWDVASV